MKPPFRTSPGKPHFVQKYGWSPAVHDEVPDRIDLVVRLAGKRLNNRSYALRIRYQQDWEFAGRREAFVHPEDHESEGIDHWPPANAIRGVNPRHSPPCICLRGAFGYHSVLHPSERPSATTLLGLLLELQGVINE